MGSLLIFVLNVICKVCNSDSRYTCSPTAPILKPKFYLADVISLIFLYKVSKYDFDLINVGF